MTQKIEKDQIFLTNFLDRLKFNYLRGKGHLFTYISNRYQWYNYPKQHKLAPFPLHVDIEISSLCDMKCPMCYTTSDIYKGTVKRTLMEMSLFCKIINESAQNNLFSIRLSLRGEPFLNPHILEMLAYTKKRGIKEVSLLTNGLKVDEGLFAKLVDSGLDWMTISIDGWGQVYESIRRPAKFEAIYRKIKNFAVIKKEKKSPKPVIKIQSVWPAVEEDPAYFYKLFKPYADEVAVNPLIDFLREDKDVAFIPDFTCPYLWQRMSIGADGNILMCQCDDMEEHLLGNAAKDSLYDVWNGKELNRIREIHIKHRGYLELRPCRHCTYPRCKEIKGEVKVENRFIKIEKYAGRKDSINFTQGAIR